jgi:hypothetical protein
LPKFIRVDITLLLFVVENLNFYKIKHKKTVEEGKNALPFTRNNRPSAKKAEHRIKNAFFTLCFDQKQICFQALYITSTAKNHTVNENNQFQNRWLITGKKPHRANLF